MSMSKTIVAYFSDAGIPKTGLTPTIRIRDVSDNSLKVTDAAMTEVGDGWYKYAFTTYDTSTEYTIRCDGTSALSGNDRYVYGSNAGETATIRKILMNRLELDDGSKNNWKLYDDDDTTIILTFDVSGKSNEPISMSSGTPAKRTRGT